MPSDPYSSLSATWRLTQRSRTLWGLGIGECQDIAAPRPTVLRDILAEFNRRRRAQRGGYARRRGSIGGAATLIPNQP